MMQIGEIWLFEKGFGYEEFIIYIIDVKNECSDTLYHFFVLDSYYPEDRGKQLARWWSSLSQCKYQKIA